MDFAARAQPTGEFRPKWKRLVATAIARLRFSLATASSHRADVETPHWREAMTANGVLFCYE
jgi:hypothetical protein